MTKKIVLSGARPTGDLHLGNYFGALHNWVQLQDQYDCHFFIADWHALTTGYAETEHLADNCLSLMADFLACGLDPDKAVLFQQSKVMEHAELFLLFSMCTPLAWLERCPTYKDQLPHLELTREIARRFNFLYSDTFPEPQPLLTTTKVLPGTDGRKMSKSYGNTISFADTPEVVRQKTMNMITDPARIRRNDPGHPEVCSVFAFHKVFNPEAVPEIEKACRQGEIGCVQCKKNLHEHLNAFHQPIHEKRTQLLGKPEVLRELIENGSNRARKQAAANLAQVRAAMKVST